MIFRAFLLSILGFNSLLYSASGQQLGTVICEETEFMRFPGRVPVKCNQEYDGIRYFVIATQDKVGLNNLNAIRNQRMQNETLRISNTPDDVLGHYFKAQM